MWKNITSSGDYSPIQMYAALITAKTWTRVSCSKGLQNASKCWIRTEGKNWGISKLSNMQNKRHSMLLKRLTSVVWYAWCSWCMKSRRWGIVRTSIVRHDVMREFMVVSWWGCHANKKCFDNAGMTAAKKSYTIRTDLVVFVVDWVDRQLRLVLVFFALRFLWDWLPQPWEFEWLGEERREDFGRDSWSNFWQQANQVRDLL